MVLNLDDRQLVIRVLTLLLDRAPDIDAEEWIKTELYEFENSYEGWMIL